ncbi:hypothetical protein [Dactylosporangium matsuzakiense]|uniref:Abortive infection protein n=1 Tax=Dactylosporangium matsuzakiense TaxID=53360 RepID=A0A9W6KZL5_9ACTN|nr:hypothetical protein [Dactylosporangium matsuzakiense]UWZ48020.1 hypothetical protein Dmats_17450 [Dactylosporangium matsuzakiense]GLL08364.1 hypothetical protein GCM10017581_101250 [Dactylosporangium matsuzakiense]
MGIRGMNYDVGTQTGPFLSREVFDAATTRRDLGVIRDELHCDAVRISGTERARLIEAAGIALELGLEVWLSPHLHDGDAEETLAHLRECAAAAQELDSERIVFLAGGELTIFMKGILKGDTLFERLRPQQMIKLRLLGTHNKPLNAFLQRAAAEVRGVFRGRVSYASAPIEKVDWSPFDFVCVDTYRGKRNRTDYGERFRRHLQHGKPVYVTEVGCCAYRGAEEKGGMGWAIVDHEHGRLDGSYVRDEELQAREVVDMADILDREGAAGVFVFTFAAPTLTHHEDPAFDLDMASYGVVRSYDDGHWEPKRLFQALAERNARAAR